MRPALLLSCLATALLLIGCASASGPTRTTTPPPDLSTVGDAAPVPRRVGDGQESGGFLIAGKSGLLEGFDCRAYILNDCRILRGGGIDAFGRSS